MALAVRMQAGRDRDLAGRVERHTDGVVTEHDGVAASDDLAGAVRRLLDERADPEAEITALCTGGRLLTAMPSRLVASPQCDRSTMMPSSFMRSTTATPKSESPALVRSVQPSPSRFREL